MHALLGSYSQARPTNFARQAQSMFLKSRNELEAVRIFGKKLKRE
jgi:hypothetical protein